MDCPSQKQLVGYVTGGHDLQAHERIEEHVDTCSICHETVILLDKSTENPFVTRPGRTSPSQDEDAELLALVQRAMPLGSRSEPASSGSAAGGEIEMLAPGTELGPYVVEEAIGAGGMGQVYRAGHSRMKRQVALKVLAPKLVGSDSARNRFQREIETVAQLRHPNIVTAYDAGEADGRCFLVLELVSGCSLDEVVRNDGPLPVDVAVDVILQAAQGLRCAHQAGIVHRDVKPANLLLDDAGVVKVLDLGLARGSDSTESRNLTHSGMMMGTAAYMAPEQAENPQQADARADIYSLGCTLFYLLTGRPVFDGETAMQIVFAHRERPLPSLIEARPDCSEWVAALFRRMTAKSPEARCPSLDEVISELTCQGNATGENRNKTVATRAHSSTATGRRTLSVMVPLLVVIVIAMLSVNWLSDVLAPQPSQIPLVLIAPGKFTMGAATDNVSARPDEKPSHPVSITRSFRLGRYEVTVGQWNAVMGSSRPLHSPAETPGDSDMTEHLPVAGISWLDAIEFCNALSSQHGLPEFYRISGDEVTIRGGTGFRLPTEAEWEFSCRAGTTSRWSFGNDSAKLTEHGWCARNANGKLQPGGQLRPNAWGLYDMHGNVPEWCWDRFDPDYYQHAVRVNPSGSTRGLQRVFRGGSASDTPEQATSSSRNPLGVSYGGFLNPVGLRVARDAF